MQIENNDSLVEIQSLKKKIEKLEEELADVKEYNEVLDRRHKVALKGFLEVDDDLEKEIECNIIGNVYDQIAK